MIKFLLLVVLVGFSNSQNKTERVVFQKQISLEIYMDLPKNGDFYVVDYPNEKHHSYTSVLYQTSPLTRVFWTSPDSFTIYHQGFPIKEPIINYSTYSSEVDGSGKQMIYLYRRFIGDTLSVIGCIDEKKCRSVRFIVE